VGARRVGRSVPDRDGRPMTTSRGLVTAPTIAFALRGALLPGEAVGLTVGWAWAIIERWVPMRASPVCVHPILQESTLQGGFAKWL